jgi:hypothetical protein
MNDLQKFNRGLYWLHFIMVFAFLFTIWGLPFWVYMRLCLLLGCINLVSFIRGRYSE